MDDCGSVSAADEYFYAEQEKQQVAMAHKLQRFDFFDYVWN